MFGVLKRSITSCFKLEMFLTITDLLDVDRISHLQGELLPSLANKIPLY